MNMNRPIRKQSHTKSLPRILQTIICLLISLSFAGNALAEGKRAAAPALEGKDLKGNKVRLSDMKGNVVVISFWATWCVPCKKELKLLSKHLKTKKEKGMRVLAISMDGPETAADVRATVKRYRWSMPIIHDKDGSITSVHNPRSAAPYTIFIDRQGRIAYAHEGFSQGDQDQLEKRIDDLLAEKSP